MAENLNLNYYYGAEAEQFSFYRIPKILLTDRRYKGVSLEAKVLYGLLLDRMGLSARNGWLDCGKDKVTKLFRELESIGLVERKKQGQGRPTRIYVKNFILEPEPAATVQTAENQQPRSLHNAAVKTAEKPQSAPPEISSQECGLGDEDGFCSLTPAQQAEFQRYFASPGEFMMLGADSICTSFTEFSKAAGAGAGTGAPAGTKKGKYTDTIKGIP